MNARKTIAVFAVLALTSVEFASAAVNNMNSRGQFVPMGSNQVAARRTYSRPAYSGRVYRAPAIVSAPAPMLATAPTEGRRFSYAPAPAAATSSPCPQGQATSAAPAVNGARRYSYAPTTESTVAPAVQPSTGTSYSRPSYSGGNRSGATVNRWALPKTDSRKFND